MKKLTDGFHALLGRVKVGIIPNYVQVRKPARVSYLYGVMSHYEVGPRSFTLFEKKRPLVGGDQLHWGKNVVSLLAKERAVLEIDRIRVGGNYPELNEVSQQLNSSVARGWLEQLGNLTDPVAKAIAMYQGMTHALFNHDWECAVELLQRSMEYFASSGYQRFAVKDRLRIAWVLLQEGNSENAAGIMKEVASSWKEMGVHKRYVPRLKQLADGLLEGN
jgi:hypothetical protein